MRYQKNLHFGSNLASICGQLSRQLELTENITEEETRTHLEAMRARVHTRLHVLERDAGMS